MKTLQKYSINFLLIAMMSILFTPFMTIRANAMVQPNNGVAPINEVSEDDISGDNQLPKVTITDATDLIERKTYDIVYLLQAFVKPFSALIFIACAIISLFGAITRSGFVGKGLIGMFISGIMYTAVLYAPEIMNFFSGWIVS